MDTMEVESLEEAIRSSKYVIVTADGSQAYSTDSDEGAGQAFSMLTQTFVTKTGLRRIICYDSTEMGEQFGVKCVASAEVSSGPVALVFGMSYDEWVEVASKYGLAFRIKPDQSTATHAGTSTLN